MFTVPPKMTAKPTLTSSSKSIAVSWPAWEQHGEGDGPVIAYRVYWKQPSGKWSSIAAHNDASVLSAIIGLLQPFTEYEVAVAAVRPWEGGEGPRSPISKIFTKCDSK